MMKIGKTGVAAVVVGLLMTVSSGSAFAGWAWDDCPPASSNETAHASQTAADHVAGLQGPVNANSHAGNSAVDGNPGSKFSGK